MSYQNPRVKLLHKLGEPILGLRPQALGRMRSRAVEERLPIKFVCCSSDAENSNKYTRWAFHTFYTGQRSPFTLIPSFDSIKISHKITPQSLKITKSAENHEPLQKIVIKRKENEDWNFGDVPSASRNTGMSYDAILDALMKLSRQAEQLSTEVAQLIDSFK